jgi:hypothetical protein
MTRHYRRVLLARDCFVGCLLAMTGSYSNETNYFPSLPAASAWRRGARGEVLTAKLIPVEAEMFQYFIDGAFIHQGALV